MSRADKTQTQITYELTLNDDNTKLIELKVTTLCAQRTSNNGFNSKKTALTTARHVAFIAVYKFSAHDAVEGFRVPSGAARLLK